jgi:hypothetical protein
LTGLAELSSRLTLAVFAAVNASLVAIKTRETRAPEHVFLAPLWVPIAGLTATIGFLIADLIAR